MFTATDVNHLLHGRWLLLDFSLRSLARLLQWMALVAMNFITSKIGVVYYG